MKLAAIILIGHIFLLLGQPCADVFVSERDLSASKVLTKSIGEIPEDPTEEDDCSPFCICSCRQVPAAFDKFTQPENIVERSSDNSKASFEYKNLLALDFSNSIWQPPKV